jgi:hypothetical protein
MPGISGPDPAVGAVGGDDEVVARISVEVGARLMLEMEPDSELARPRLEDVQKPLSADAGEAVARRAHEFALDDGARHRIIRHEIVDRLVGEDHAPAERVVGAVALIEVDLVRGVAQLHRNREIEPGRSPAQAGDAHRLLPCLALA